METNDFWGRSNCLHNRFAVYRGWGCFLSTVIIGLICVGLVIGFAGPAYHDCQHNDCSTQQSYGMYCEDYCWHDHSGPGSGLVVLIFCGILFALALPFCFGNERERRRVVHGGYSYDLVNTQIIF